MATSAAMDIALIANQLGMDHGQATGRDDVAIAVAGNERDDDRGRHDG